MTDLTKVSDAELRKLYGQPDSVPKVSGADLSAMSDDELSAALKSSKPADGLTIGKKPATSWDTPPLEQGMILPLTRDPATGKSRFDPDAGLLGLAKRAFTLPDRVRRGEVDPKSEEATGEVLDAAMAMTPMGPIARMGGHGARAVAREAIKAPAAEALDAAATKGFGAVRKAGVDYSAKAGADMARTVSTGLEADGVLPILAPKTHSVLKSLSEPPPNAVLPVSGLDAARKALRNIAGDFTNPTEQMAARRAIDQIDEFILAADPKNVVAGAAAAEGVGKELAGARGNYAAARRSGRLTGIEEAADLRAGAANSGQNLDNAIRSRSASVLLDPKKAAGFTAAEKDELGAIAKGTLARNTARFTGNLLGGGGGMAAMIPGVAGVTAAMTTGNLPAAALGLLPVVGYGAKKAGSAMTERALGRLDEATRMRSPLAEELARQAPTLPVLSDKMAAVYRALLAGGSGAAERP